MSRWTSCCKSTCVGPPKSPRLIFDSKELHECSCFLALESFTRVRATCTCLAVCPSLRTLDVRLRFAFLWVFLKLAQVCFTSLTDFLYSSWSLLYFAQKLHKHAKKISVALRKFERVIVDYRIPDQIRIAISPMAMTYDEVYRGMKRIRESVIRKDYLKVNDSVSEVT